MSEIARSPGRAWAGASLLALALALGGAGATRAQSAAANRTAPTFAFHIPPKSLLAALADFTATTRVQVVRPGGDAVAGRSAGVDGVMSANEALSRLLTGSGLSHRFSGAATVTLVSQRREADASAGPQDGATQLQEIEVEGEGQSATGPGVGYVATRSLSATKSDAPIIETPQSISVVTRRQMDDQKVQNVGQALRYTSGVAPETRAATTMWDFPTARGFSPDVYLDGLKLPLGSLFNLPQPNVYDLDRIEYLRGPASVLYGQASPGGVLNLTSKRPTETPFREVQFLAGSYGRAQAAFDLGGPLTADGSLLYRLNGFGFTGDTQVDFTKQKQFGISPAITWRPDADTTLTILGDYVNTPAGYYDNVPAQGSYLPNPAGKIPTSFFAGEPSFDSFHREQASVGYLFEHRFDDTWTVRQNLRYTDVKIAWDAVLSTTSPQIEQGVINRYAFTDRAKFDGLTIDNQAQAEFATGPLSHTVVFGLDYQRMTADEKISRGTAPPQNFPNPVYGIPITPGPLTTNAFQTRDQVGLYAQDQIKIDRWRILVGGRQDFASSNTRNRLNHTTTDADDRAFTGRVGLVYLFDNGLAPYASYSESFQPLAGVNSSGKPFKPTTGTQYEAGVKYQPPGYNAFVTVSAFDLRQQNVRTTDPDRPTLGFQTGEVRSRGVEVEGRASVNENLDLIAAYAYLDAEVTKSKGVNLGKTPVQVPKHTASLWADYSMTSGVLNGLTLGGGVRYVGSTFGDAVNAYKVPSFTLFDAMLRYDLGKVSDKLNGVRFQLNVSNLFDKRYVSSCNQAPDFCFFGTRRTTYASVSYRW